MRPVRSTEAHATDRLGELVCSNSLRSDDAETNAVGVLHAELRACGSLVMRAADAHQVPAGGALAVDREGFAAAITEALEAHPLIEIRREEIDGPARSRLGQRDRRLRPPHLAGAGRGDRRADRRDAARLLRRDRADRPFRQRRHVDLLDAVALRQGGPGRHRRRLSQLPDEQGAVRGLRRRLARGREGVVQGLGGLHPLFRRLPAGRGDGRARPRGRCATGR